MTNKPELSKTCCFTGHRPERLKAPEKKVIEWLEEQIDKAIADGYTDFISGTQRGVDIWAAEIVLKKKREGKNVRLICAVPWAGVEREWEQNWKERYYQMMNNADERHFICNYPGRNAFFERNHWMVDHSSLLIAAYTGAPGGTKETIDYAEEKGLEVRAMPKKL